MQFEEEEAPAGAPLWMLSYGDMVTNLLCFFVLLFAMSKVDTEKVIGLLESLSETFNPRSVEANATPTGPVENPYILGNSELVPMTGMTNPVISRTSTMGGKNGRRSGGSKMEEDLGEIAKEVEELAVSEQLTKQLTVEVNARGVVISFAETATNLDNIAPFESGSAQLRPRFARVLDKLAPVLRTTANKIEVQGHTDPRPIHTPAFPSNWELSGARAGSVVRYFAQTHKLNRHQFVCTGFADTIPIDRGNNPTAWARNRRIEVVITRQPIAAYDELSRADVVRNPTDITHPIGSDVVSTGLPTPP